MITNKKEIAVFVSFFAVCISILTINVVNNFNYLDFVQLFNSLYINILNNFYHMIFVLSRVAYIFKTFSIPIEII